MDPIEIMVDAHLDAWNAPAGAERTRLIAATYSPEVFVGEPQGSLHGHDGMEQAIAGIQAQLPGTAISRSGPIQVAQDLVTYSWSLGSPDGPVLATGRDVLLVRDDTVAGLEIVSLYVVIDAA